MANVRVRWTYPTVRVPSGRPLPVSEIDRVVLEMSADGQKFVVVGEYRPPTVKDEFQELEPGEWTFRGTVYDTAGRPGVTATMSITVPVPEDTSGPGPLTLELELF